VTDERLDAIRMKLEKHGASAMDEGELIDEIYRLRSLLGHCDNDDCDRPRATWCDDCMWTLYGMNP
jgi:hypothetical protein